MSVDLHLHTHHSDGSWSPTQVIEQARRLKFRQIAVTDHDTTDGIDEAIAAAGETLEVIPGIEINTVLPRVDGPDVDVHILGYFIEPSSSKLRATIERQQKARLRLVDDVIEKLNSLGVNLTFEHIKNCAGSGSIGRPHITRAIVQVGGAANVVEAYERFMSRNSPDYVRRHSVTPQEAIEAIADAGGVASIAHPGKGEEVSWLIPLLKEAGLRAIEAYHRSHSLQTVKYHLKYAREHGMLVTGGSDCHGPSDGYGASIGSVRVPLEVVYKLKAAITASCGKK